MNLVLLQGILALTFSHASSADVKRQLGYTDVGSYHTFFDAHPTPFIAIARADTQAPPLTSVGLAQPAGPPPPLQAINTAPLHDFNLQTVPHAVLLTPVAAKGIALNQGWHGFETAPLNFAPTYTHKALVPVQDAPFELTPVLQNYGIPKTLSQPNFGQNHIANNFNKHLNTPLTQFTGFHGDIRQFPNTFQAPSSGYDDGSVQNDAVPLVTQTAKPINQPPPTSGQGLISSPAPVLSSPAYDTQSPSSQKNVDHGNSFGRDSGFQVSHHYSPSGLASPQPSYNSPQHSHKSSGHQTVKHQPSKHHSLFGASGSGGTSSPSAHTPSPTHHTAPSGFGHSSISSSSPGHTTKGYSYTTGHGSSGHSGSYHSSHRPSSSGYGSTGFSSSSSSHSGSQNRPSSSGYGTTGFSSSSNSHSGSQNRPSSSGYGSTGFSSSSSSHSGSQHTNHGGTSEHDESSSNGDKATSFQSFVIHSYKPVPVYTKKSEYRHYEPSPDKHYYHSSSYFGNSKEHHDDRSY